MSWKDSIGCLKDIDVKVQTWYHPKDDANIWVDIDPLQCNNQKVNIRGYFLPTSIVLYRIYDSNSMFIGNYNYPAD